LDTRDEGDGHIRDIVAITLVATLATGTTHSLIHRGGSRTTRMGTIPMGTILFPIRRGGDILMGTTLTGIILTGTTPFLTLHGRSPTIGLLSFAVLTTAQESLRTGSRLTESRLTGDVRTESLRIKALPTADLLTMGLLTMDLLTKCRLLLGLRSASHTERKTPSS
jgi:hypothetical protein